MTKASFREFPKMEIEKEVVDVSVNVMDKGGAVSGDVVKGVTSPAAATGTKAARTQTGTKTGVRTGVQAQTKAEAQAQTKVETQAQTKVEAQAQTKVETQAQTKAEAQAQTKAQVQTKAETRTQTGTKTGVRTGVHAQTKTQTQAQALKRWFIAMVKHNRERSVAKIISERFALETYVASRKEMKVYTNGTNKGRKKVIEKVLIPSKVFIHCTEEDRLYILKNTGIVEHFMPDRTKSNGLSSPPAYVPDNDMDSFRKMLCYGDDTFVFDEYAHYEQGETVVVTAGALEGVQGVITNVDGNACLSISIASLGGARVRIDPHFVRPVK